MVSTLDRTLPGFYFVSLECYILFVAGLFSCIFSFFSIVITIKRVKTHKF